MTWGVSSLESHPLYLKELIWRLGRACQNEEAFDQSKNPCFGAFDHDIASSIQITAQRQFKVKGLFFYLYKF